MSIEISKRIFYKIAAVPKILITRYERFGELVCLYVSSYFQAHTGSAVIEGLILVKTKAYNLTSTCHVSSLWTERLKAFTDFTLKNVKR